MEENNTIFVDSNYFVALFNLQDSLYQKAIHIASVLDRKRINLAISNFIFLEVVTILSQRRGRTAGVEVGAYLQQSPDIKIIHIDEALQEDSWGIFQKTKEKDISFVDCSIVAAMKAEHILHLLTFDVKEFKKLQNRHRFSLYAVS